MKDFLIVGMGGLIGTVLRYGLALGQIKYYPDKFYLATLIVNLTGSLIIGLSAGFLSKINTQLGLFIMAGFCGGFTTFSAFCFDGLKLLKNGMYFEFGLYLFASLIGGVSLCAIGFFITNK